MFLTLTATPDDLHRANENNKVTINIEHIACILDSDVGAYVELSSKSVIAVTETRTEVLSLIEQVFAADRAAYSMLLDQGETDALGWPTYNYRPKDQN